MATELEEQPDDIEQGFLITVHVPDSHDLFHEEENDDVLADDFEERVSEHRDTVLKPIFEILDQEVSPLFDKRWHGSGRPPHCGDHYDIMLWVANTVAGGLAWDFLKSAAASLWKMLSKAQADGVGIELDANGLMILAIGCAKRRVVDFSTDTSLIGRIEDNRTLDLPWLGGSYVYVLPDLKNKNSHIITLSGYGHLLFHEIGNFLSNDAASFLESSSEEDWAWSSDERWTW